ncbi:MAG: hypothetical protein ACR2MW_09465 [Chthoniobacterales bacterium]
MKSGFLLFLLLLNVSVSLAESPPVPARRLKDLHDFPLVEARRMLPKALARSLEISPVEAWVVARAHLYSGKPAATKIIHAEADGAYDPLIMALADQYQTSGGDTTETRIAADTLTFNLVVFTLKAGKMAILIPHSDDARYGGFYQTGDAWIGIYKDGKWTQVSHPQKDRRRR